MNKRITTIGRIAVLVTFAALGGCATTTEPNKDDPWEGWNRGVYKFNKALDTAIAKPVTKGYKAITPDVVEKGVSNIFSNLADVPTMINNLLQGKVTDSASDLGRFVLNTTVGLAGIWDPASKLGLEKHDEDFGQTLGAWGVGSGPYVMLPLVGPSTLRDTAALIVDAQMDLINEIDHKRTRYEVKVLQMIDGRARLMALEDQLEDATDEYAFIRDVYLQNRRYKVLDGDIPFEEECEEEDEEDCEF
ncbi:MlaA family lipoprotein [Aliikangiella coralliicola]|uniref:VacJ family lipoprotein n=1 Tax=Aliikangiella coralliicola TaxID=2592383 RepID=A0A545U0A5_9GAMM|nr:VacJ family lipoprotein [Aliikangiella coralliicola]TQV82897.1 VacJ family lipoprotein [Aliikangiella coralliicola]